MDYHLIKQLSSNENTTVALCAHTITGALYSVKKVPHSRIDRDRIKTETEIALQLCHPLIPRLIDVLDHDNYMVFIYDYVEGLSLEDYVDMNGTIPEAKAVRWLLQFCDILHYLHTAFPQPVIHRDIKPANLIIDAEDNLHLIDFNIARYAKPAASRDTACLGSIGFAAPEQYGAGQSDARTDLYGTGVSIYYALTGNRLDEPPYQVLPPYIINKGISKSFSDIIVKLTQADPAMRYSSTKALEKSLARIGSRRKRRTIGISAVAGAAAVAIAAFLMFNVQPTAVTAVETPQPPSSSAAQQKVQPVDNSESGANSTTAAVPVASPVDYTGDDTVVAFVDPEMERLLRISLDRTDNDPVTRSELAALSELKISGSHVLLDKDDFEAYYTDTGTVQSIEDLRFCTGLTVLYLGGNPISDVSPLSGLINLQELRLYSNAISDISPLSSLTNLTYIDLSDNPIADPSPLSSLSNLVILQMGRLDVGLENIDFIAGMTTLKRVFLEDTGLTSIEALRGLNNLEELDISRNSVTDLSPIADKASLYLLRASGNGLTDISALSGLTSLETLSIDGNSITDLTPLAGISALKWLDLQNNAIAEFSVVASLESLEYVNISGNPGASSVTLQQLSSIAEVVYE